jgi:hypothetical protein
VSCDDDEYAPTEAERAAIEASLATASFPTSASTLRGSRPEALAGEDHENIFWFTDPSGKHVSFLQCRRNGEKPDLPWSYWSDGKWRMMEPDGPLPLYGLDQIRHLNPLDRKSPIAWPRRGVMIHEGAKTAARVHDFVHENPSIDHPWKGDLRHYAHLGFPGGIYNVHRVDWSPIKRLAPGREVVVAADHDRGGERAAAEISSIIRRSMKVVMFDTNFPDAFDLADPWPKPRTFWQGARYCGPTLDDFTFPATWATKLTDVPGVKKPVAKIRDQFADEWYWVEDLDAFIHRDQVDRIRPTAKFNGRVRPFSHVDDTARIFMKLFSPKVDAVCYRPGDPQGIVNITGRRCINTHRPTAIVAVKGSAWPFFRFMRHLIPDQIDRRHVLRWIATLVVRTDIHMSVIILLLISTTQGVGKTTLILDILRPLVGPWNTSCPTEKEIVGSDFDEWKAHKRLACVNEIYSGKSRKMYDALKEMTDATTRINRKYLPRYEVENYLHVAACSNSEAALHLGDEDRRTLVPRVTDKIKPKEYWTEFHDWLRSGGLERIRSGTPSSASRTGRAS